MKQMMIRIAIVVALNGWTLSFPTRAEDRKPDNKQQMALRAFDGEIISIEKVAKAITVRKFPVSKRFLVAVTCKITTSDKPDTTLQDLKVGDKVKLKYEEEKDGFVARSIIIRGIDDEDREEAREKEKLERR
jgi:Cu/Ag efflux protein CusF